MASDVKKNEGGRRGRGEEMKRENKNIPDHNMSLSFFLFKMIEKEGKGWGDEDGTTQGWKGAHWQGGPVNLEAELSRNSRDESACLMDRLHCPCGGGAKKTSPGPHRTALSETFTATGQAGYPVNRVH